MLNLLLDKNKEVKSRSGSEKTININQTTKNTIKKLQIIICILFFLTGRIAFAQTSQLYGMTHEGGTNNLGTIFKMNLNGSGFMTVYEFSAVPGCFPQGNLIKATNNLLYGMTTGVGSYLNGTIFSFNPVTGYFSTLVNFSGLDGSIPIGSLFQANNGLIYGMTQGGGANLKGVLFSYNIVTTQFTKIIDFDGTTKGSYPYGNLIQATNGVLYGLTKNGGNADAGVLFSIDPANNNLFTKWDLFTNTGDPKHPSGSLMMNGSLLYGTSYDGGSCNKGTVFTFNTITNTFSMAMQFCGTAADFGSYPEGDLVSVAGIPATKFYGMTTKGGSLDNGVLFKFDNQTITHTNPVTFDGVNKGSKPKGSLVKASDGKLYGMTSEGGANGKGVVFSFDPSNNTFLKLHDFNIISGTTEGGYPFGDLLEVTCTAAPSSPGIITIGRSTAFVCPGDISVLSVVSVPGVTYNWTAFAGASIDIGQGTNLISVSYNSSFTAATGIIQVTASNSCGTSTASSITITRGAGITGNIAYSGNSSKVCPGDTRTYDVTPVTGYTYNWTAFAGAVITAGQGTASITVNYTSAFTGGILSVTTTNSCGTSAPISLAIAMNTLATPGRIYGTSSVCHNTTYTYSISAVTGANPTGYVWTVSTGGSIQGSNSGTSVSIHWGATQGNRTITVKASNGCGFSGIRSNSISVNCRESDMEKTAIEFNVEVFPNPTNGRVTLKFSSDKNETCKLIIADIAGRIISHEQIHSTEGVNEHIADMSNLVKGIYFLKMKTASGEFTKRIIKE